MRWVWMAWSLCVLGVGCVSTSQTDGLRQHLREHPGPEPDRTKIQVRGDVMLAELAVAMRAAYGVGLLYPDVLRDRWVTLPGEVSETELQRLIEAQVECQVIVSGRVWSLVAGTERFSVVISGSLASGVAGIADVTYVGGRYIASGEMRNLPALRRLVEAIDLPRAGGRLQLWLIERSTGERLALSISPGWAAGYRDGWFSSFDADFVADVFKRGGVVHRELELMVTDGVPLEYRDETEVRVERYLSSGENDRLFRSDSEVVSAGLTVTLLPVRLGRVWRLGGAIEVSDFAGGGGSIPDRIRRSLTVEVDMGSGSTVRLGRVELSRRSASAGMVANAFSGGAEKGASVFDVWVSVEDVLFDNVPSLSAAARDPSASLPPSPPEPGQ